MRKQPATLAGIDLNLLVALDALLREESVTAAGRRVGLSQPAMSHALARLRELLDDELLVREGRFMQKSELGRELAPTVRRLVEEIEGTLLGRKRFDPATTARSFRIAANDYCGAVLLPRLLARVRKAAPGVQIDVHPQEGPPPAGELARGELDLVMGTHARVEPPLVRRELFRESFVCALRRNHPRARRLTLERYVELDHLLVANPGYGPGVVDCALEERGLRRRVAMRVPHFLVAPAIVAETDLVLTLPKRVLHAAPHLRLRVVKPPLELEDFAVDLIWHRRADADPSSLWLRDQIAACARHLRAD